MPEPNRLLSMGLYDNWDVLPLAQTQTTTSIQGDIIYPPNYKFSADSDEWPELSESLVRELVIPSNGDAPYEADEFEIGELALRHKTDPAQSTTFQCPGASLPSKMP